MTRKSDHIIWAATNDMLERSNRMFQKIAQVTFIMVPVCMLLGIWVDVRWFWTTIPVALTWVVANASSDRIEREIKRRKLNNTWRD